MNTTSSRLIALGFAIATTVALLSSVGGMFTGQQAALKLAAAQATVAQAATARTPA